MRPPPVVHATSTIETPEAAERPVLACRPMRDADRDAAVALLATGFPERGPAYWHRGLERLATRAVPPDRPRYGYVMTDRGRLVGIILVIFTEADDGTVRGNVSSWYVTPQYRGLSHLLLAAALKRGGVLFNISPAPSTLATIAAQGFEPYVAGSAIAAATLARPVRGATVRPVTPATAGAPILLRDHAGWGCLALEVVHAGVAHPFVFVPSRLSRMRLPCAILAYCRSVDAFARFAGPLGRHLMRHGLPLVVVDAAARPPGVPGVFRPGRGPKVVRGAPCPRLGDLSYTELAIFGP